MMAYAGDGYDEDFLGLTVPLPGPVAGTPVRLDYPRFTVLLDTERRLAAMTAVNIDGATLRDVPRTGDWRLDRRVGPDEQAGPAVYADNDLDRGHLVRRRDPGWGAPAEARAATEATFVYPNAAPQAAVFNQSKQLWLGLEDHVLEYADAQAHRVSVFTAPVLGADDLPYRGVQVPRRFFKIAVWVTVTAEGVAPAAAGFVLDQSSLIDAAAGRLTVAPLGAYRTFQVPIADVAAIAAVDFGALVAADVLAAEAVRGAAAWHPLDRPQDVVLGYSPASPPSR